MPLEARRPRGRVSDKVPKDSPTNSRISNSLSRFVPDVEVVHTPNQVASEQAYLSDDKTGSKPDYKGAHDRRTSNNIDYLEKTWGPDGWLPRGIKPAWNAANPGQNILQAMVTITKYAQVNELDLPGLWKPGGIIFEAMAEIHPDPPINVSYACLQHAVKECKRIMSVTPGRGYKRQDTNNESHNGNGVGPSNGHKNLATPTPQQTPGQSHRDRRLSPPPSKSTRSLDPAKSPSKPGFPHQDIDISIPVRRPESKVGAASEGPSTGALTEQERLTDAPLGGHRFVQHLRKGYASRARAQVVTATEEDIETNGKGKGKPTGPDARSLSASTPLVRHPPSLSDVGPEKRQAATQEPVLDSIQVSLGDPADAATTSSPGQTGSDLQPGSRPSSPPPGSIHITSDDETRDVKTPNHGVVTDGGISGEFKAMEQLADEDGWLSDDVVYMLAKRILATQVAATAGKPAADEPPKQDSADGDNLAQQPPVIRARRAFVSDSLYMQIDDGSSSGPNALPRGMELSKVDDLLIPMHHRRTNHWTLLWVHFPNSTAWYYDSLPNASRRAQVARLAKERPLKCTSFHIWNGPEQKDASSCGPCVLAALKHVLAGKQLQDLQLPANVRDLRDALAREFITSYALPDRLNGLSSPSLEALPAASPSQPRRAATKRPFPVEGAQGDEPQRRKQPRIGDNAQGMPPTPVPTPAVYAADAGSSPQVVDLREQLRRQTIELRRTALNLINAQPPTRLAEARRQLANAEAGHERLKQRYEVAAAAVEKARKDVTDSSASLTTAREDEQAVKALQDKLTTLALQIVPSEESVGKARATRLAGIANSTIEYVQSLIVPIQTEAREAEAALRVAQERLDALSRSRDGGVALEQLRAAVEASASLVEGLSQQAERAQEQVVALAIAEVREEVFY